MHRIRCGPCHVQKVMGKCTVLSSKELRVGLEMYSLTNENRTDQQPH
jgi:hypothetical protein